MAVPIVAGIGAVGAATVLGAYNAFELYNQRPALANAFQDSIVFPSDLNRTNIPFISMQFKRYERRSINQQPFYTNVMKIRLPIPENLVERTAVTYNNQELGSIIGSAIEAGSAGSQSPGTTIAGGAALGALGAAPQIAGALAAGLQPGAARTAATLGAGALNVAAGLTSAAAGALFGITTNPYQVVLFKSPEFRTHSFTWKLIPNSLQESESLKQLIETFRYHSLPGISVAGALLFSYPEILEINFRPSDTYLYKFKPCVVKGITVNYAPNSPSFVRSSGAPTAVQFQIDLQEIEIMTKADFFRDQSGIYSSTTAPRGLDPRGAEGGGAV
jgi:hypothetical protein